MEVQGFILRRAANPLPGGLVEAFYMDFVHFADISSVAADLNDPLRFLQNGEPASISPLPEIWSSY